MTFQVFAVSAYRRCLIHPPSLWRRQVWDQPHTQRIGSRFREIEQNGCFGEKVGEATGTGAGNCRQPAISGPRSRKKFGNPLFQAHTLEEKVGNALCQAGNREEKLGTALCHAGIQKNKSEICIENFGLPFDKSAIRKNNSAMHIATLDFPSAELKFRSADLELANADLKPASAEQNSGMPDFDSEVPP